VNRGLTPVFGVFEGVAQHTIVLHVCCPCSPSGTGPMDLESARPPQTGNRRSIFPRLGIHLLLQYLRLRLSAPFHLTGLWSGCGVTDPADSMGHIERCNRLGRGSTSSSQARIVAHPHCERRSLHQYAGIFTSPPVHTSAYKALRCTSKRAGHATPPCFLPAFHRGERCGMAQAALLEVVRRHSLSVDQANSRQKSHSSCGPTHLETFPPRKGLNAAIPENRLLTNVRQQACPREACSVRPPMVNGDGLPTA